MEKEQEWKIAPELAQWDITKNCNLACKHCRATLIKDSRDLEYVEVTRILEQILLLSPNITIAWAGGEPLMRPDLKEILTFVKEHSPSTDMQILTNGTLITEKNTDWLTELIKGFNISLEGSTPEINDAIRGNGSFKKAVSGISLLTKKDVPVTVRMTFFHQPEKEVENLMRFLPEIGVNRFNFRYLVPVGRASGQEVSAEEYKRLCENIWQLGQELGLKIGFSDPFPEILINPQYRKTIEEDRELLGGRAVAGCSVAFRLLYLDPEGRVRLCPYLPLVCADAKEKPLKDIWFSNKTLSAFRGARNALEGKCGACEFKFACGGCLGAASASGDFLGGDPRCWYTPSML